MSEDGDSQAVGMYLSYCTKDLILVAFCVLHINIWLYMVYSRLPIEYDAIPVEFARNIVFF